MIPASRLQMASRLRTALLSARRTISADSIARDAFYGLNRDEMETERLNKQHRIITSSCGFLVHPNIPIKKSNLRIADFATGTGLWLLELSKVIPVTCQLTGFDISSAQFPRTPGEVPENVTFKVQDILSSVPDSCCNQFDIIAVRFLILALTGDEWERAVANLIRLLKPGGWLQWIDTVLTPESWRVVQSQAAASTHFLSKGIDTVNKRATKLQRSLDESRRLPDIFRAHGLEHVHHDVISSDNDASTRRDFTIELTTALSPLFLRYAEMENTSMTIEEAVALGDGMMMEAQSGKAYLRWDTNVTVGRKSGV